ncbi:MAG TPA: DUF2332 domain-containing protein [Candidatus Limnocylindria bacterium]|nr:DUF2332 domain-containing protein [Candidatus Limnocylindria bacterium]
MQRPPSEDDPAALNALLEEFRRFGRHEIPPQGSAVYAALCEALADDPHRAALALAARPAFRGPLILLAAVHHLLLSGVPAPLAAYYPSVAGDAARPVDGGLYPAFAAFVDEHRDEVLRLVATRSTQTNEARRTVVTLPALGLVHQRDRRPLALLEVGASAGLCLLPDRYGYRIGALVAGDPASPVQVDCEVRGDLVPPVPPVVPPIAWRLGVDLNPLDVRDPDTRGWLRALVWPEHRDRLALLDAALGVAGHDPPAVTRGDLVDDLPRLVARAPHDAILVVTSTWTLAYLDPEERLAFIDGLGREAASARRDIWLVAGEGRSVLASLELGVAEAPADGSYGGSMLSLHRFGADGRTEHRLLAETHPHGRWIRWLDQSTAGRRA